MRKFLLIITLFVITIFMSARSNKVFADLITKPSQTTQTQSVSQKDLQVKEFIEACKQGNLEKVRALIKQGVDVNMSVWEIRGVYQSKPPVFGRTMRSGFTTPSSQTPLLVAISNRHIDIVKELINAGANVNKGNSSKETPLMFASIGGHNEIVKILLSAGADINAKSSSYSSSKGPRSYTALYFASENGHLQVENTLL